MSVQKSTIKLKVEVQVAEDGLATISSIMYEDGSPLIYESEEKRTIIGSRLMLTNQCCWGSPMGRWVCLPDYCRK